MGQFYDCAATEHKGPEGKDYLIETGEKLTKPALEILKLRCASTQTGAQKECTLNE